MTTFSLDGDLRARARPIRLLCLDVDGVLTDGKLYFLSDGVEAKSFNIRDGLGLKLLMQAGVQIALITGRRSSAARARAQELGIAHYFEGVEDKRVAATQLLTQLALPPQAMAAMGDDLPDLPMLRTGGLALTVPDAPEWVKAQAHYVTRQRGGEGAVREVCELILRAQDRLQSALDGYMT